MRRKSLLALSALLLSFTAPMAAATATQEPESGCCVVRMNEAGNTAVPRPTAPGDT